MENLQNIFRKNDGFLKSKDIVTRTQWRYLCKMLNDNSVTKIKRGLYRFNDNSSTYQYAEIVNLIPEGVLCMYSTWLHYELSVQIPQCFHIAVEKSRKIVLPDYPPIKLYFWKQEYYELGIEDQIIDGFSIKMYDLEKSVCDAVKFRNKIGMETTAEIIRNYLNLKERNFTKLMKYAQIMRIEKTMRTYIEIQL